MSNNMPTIDTVRTGQRIVALRKQAGLSVKDLQNIFGFTTPQAIYKWQQGAAMPTIDNLVVLSVVFGIAIDEIIVLQNAPDIFRLQLKPDTELSGILCNHVCRIV